MAQYMTQQMSSPKTIPITYYRRQSRAHVTHEESGAFTQAAQANYAQFNHIAVATVISGTYRSGQGVPTGGKTFEI